jgi:hypothetical protein
MRDLTYGSPYLALLKDRVNLYKVPFSERGSRLMLFRTNAHLSIRLAERWFKLDNQLSSYRTRPPIVDAWVLTDTAGATLPFHNDNLSTLYRDHQCQRHLSPDLCRPGDAAADACRRGEHGLRFRAALAIQRPPIGAAACCREPAPSAAPLPTQRTRILSNTIYAGR